MDRDPAWQKLAEQLRTLQASRAAKGPDPTTLLHELHVHQEELEMQNRELREAHADLEESRSRYADLYDRAPVGYATLDASGKILDANLTAAGMFGLEREQLVGSPLSALGLADPGRLFDHLAGATPDGGTRHVEVDVVGRAGPLTLQLSTTAYVDPSSGRLLYRTTMSDVTELRRAQTEASRGDSERKARAAAEATSSMKDRFLGVLSHELRTPLTALLGWTQLLRRRPDDAKLVGRGLDVMQRNGEWLARMVEDMLDMSRIVSGKLRVEREVVDAADAVRAALQTVGGLASVKHIALHSSLAPDCRVWGDTQRLQQVASNLLTNAIKFTPRHGHVWITLEPHGGTVSLEVRDDGAGIDPEDMAYMFEPFRQADETITRSAGGLGLGLAIVRSLVEAHGGTVFARSLGAGHGSTFVVELPRVTQALTAARPPTRDDAANSFLAGMKILCVDDQPDTLELLARLLGHCGAVVRTATSAASAIAAASSFEPDAIVSDLSMPERDGFDLVRELRGMPGRISRVPAVALTACARPEDAEEARRAGFDRLLTKPIEGQALAQALFEVVSPA